MLLPSVQRADVCPRVAQAARTPAENEDRVEQEAEERARDPADDDRDQPEEPVVQEVQPAEGVGQQGRQPNWPTADDGNGVAGLDRAAENAALKAGGRCR